ncbi:hypothetical protein G7Y89_g11706 [Cudoniella acicularis]|uniref:Uncharacterized protein n=1 Tax=Cudoniella acicularis TaxID=354080 RepID=A0A8H4RAD4_9HELO|nr:hypothetical protein G7Y89_g11706 [Cudoniella acicularis]
MSAAPAPTAHPFAPPHVESLASLPLDCTSEASFRHPTPSTGPLGQRQRQRQREPAAGSGSNRYQKAAEQAVTTGCLPGPDCCPTGRILWGFGRGYQPGAGDAGAECKRQALTWQKLGEMVGKISEANWPWNHDDCWFIEGSATDTAGYPQKKFSKRVSGSKKLLRHVLFS